MSLRSEPKALPVDPGRAMVHFIVPGAIPEDAARSAATADERNRASRFHFPADSARWLSYRAQMRMILGEIIGLAASEVPLILSNQGKPLLAPPFDFLHFNLTHCPDLGLLVVCRDGPVGIDLESHDRASQLTGCEANFCHPAEILKLPAGQEPRETKLLALWTAKEAVLKALGTGLIHPPEALQVRMIGQVGIATSEPPLAGIESQQIRILNHPRLKGYQAVVSIPTTVGIIEVA